jgi:HNH endonuclease
MERSSTKERERVFGLLASNLAALFPGEKDTVVCPLCRCRYGPDSLLGDDPLLTLEHCVPRSLGGKFLTLTCKACNNAHGSSHDSHLKKMLMAEDAIEGIGGTVDATVSIQGHSHRCSVRFGPSEQRHIYIQSAVKASNQREIDATSAIFETASKTGAGFDGQLSLRFGYAQQPWRVALVKSAYLLIFRQFGYSYMLFDGPEFVRRQLLESDYDVLAAACALKSDAGAIPHVNRVLIVTSPVELRSFLVPVQVRTEYRTKVKFVVLPGFDDDPTGIYDRWKQAGQNGRINDVNFTALDAGLNSLTDPLRLGALALWDRTFGRRPRRVYLKKSNGDTSRCDSTQTLG